MIINRRKTRIVKIGNRAIGGNNPILIQSMTNTATEDVRATVDQIKELERLGREVIRVSLTGDPRNEVKTVWETLKSLHIKERRLSIVSCLIFTCTKIPFEKIASYLERFSGEFSTKLIKMAIRGCIVTGLGEAEEADLAFVGLENRKSFFPKRRICS